MRRSPFLAGIAASATALPRAAWAQALQLTVANAPIDSGMTPVVAERAGFYRKYGLDVQLVTMSSGAAVSAAVVGGSLQIGSSSLPGVIAAHTKGVPFQLVTPASVYISDHPSDVLLVRADGPIRRAADLNGKTIASPALHDLLSTTTLAWIDQNGGDSKTVHQIELPPSATPAALQAGRIDAAGVSEPRVSELVASGVGRVLGKPYDVIAPSFLISGFFALPDVIAANRDAIVRLARAHHDANVFANAHHDQTAVWLSEAANVELSAVQHAQRAFFADRLDPAMIQPVIDASAKFGLIDKSFSARDIISPVVATLKYT
ncbi:MAG: ABC transporter substrate-binding protein [Candidatus Lustribacter sp.]|jgi:NitT/TauT family transport system substrate-binding protein